MIHWDWGVRNITVCTIICIAPENVHKYLVHYQIHHLFNQKDEYEHLQSTYNINILLILNLTRYCNTSLAIQLITHTHKISTIIGSFSLSLSLNFSLGINRDAIDMSILFLFHYFSPFLLHCSLCRASLAVSFNCLVFDAWCSVLVVFQPDSYIYEIVINRERTDLLFYHYLYLILRIEITHMQDFRAYVAYVVCLSVPQSSL